MRDPRTNMSEVSSGVTLGRVGSGVISENLSKAISGNVSKTMFEVRRPQLLRHPQDLYYCDMKDLNASQRMTTDQVDC